MTVNRQATQDRRATAYRARRDAQTPAERKEELRKQRIASRAFQARKSRKSSKERSLAVKEAADYQRDYQRTRRASETPEEHDIRRAKQREYNRKWRAKKGMTVRKKADKRPRTHADQLTKQREYNRALRRAWEAMNPESPEQHDIRNAKRRKQRTPEQRQREYRARKANESPEKRNIRVAKARKKARTRRANETLEQRAKRREYNREYNRERYANVEERRERDRRSLKPYSKSYRDKMLANYASKGLTVSQRVLDELNGNRDPQTPPLFRRS